MGLFQTIRDALGLNGPLVVQAWGPMTLSAEAIRTIRALPPGKALHVYTVPLARGRALATEVVDAPEGDGSGKSTLVVMSTEDRDHLRGLELHHDGERWLARIELRVLAKETPNPNGRLYDLSRALAHGAPRFFVRGDEAPPPADALLAIPGVASVLFRDHHLTVEREGDTSWRGLDAAVETALRAHVQACGKALPALIREGDDGLAAEVARVLAEEVAPAIHADGGDIELVDVSPQGDVQVRMVGACRSCPASEITLKMGVEEALKQAFPGRVRSVVQV